MRPYTLRGHWAQVRFRARLEIAATHEAQGGEAAEMRQGAGLPPRQGTAANRQMLQPTHFEFSISGVHTKHP